MVAEWLMKAISNMVSSHILSLLLLIGLNYYIYLHAKKTPLMISYIILSIGPFLWILGKLLKTVSPYIGLRWSFIMVQYLGMSILGPAFFIFCLTYFLGHRIKSRLLILCYLPAAILYLLVLTNPFHHQFYPVFTFYRDSFRSVFYALKLEIYLSLGLGFIFLILAVLRHRKKQIFQSILFMLASIAPLAGSFYYPSLGTRFSGLRFDIVPLCFNITFLFFGIAVFRYDFLNISAVVHRQLLNALKEGICILDSRGRTVYRNKFADCKTDPPQKRSLKRSVFRIPGRFHGSFLDVEGTIDITAETERKEEIKKRTDRISSLTKSIEEKINQEREILFIQQRNQAAQELHDILGHSLTVFIAQMEAMKLIDDSAKRKKQYKKIYGQFNQGKTDLESALDSRLENEVPEYMLLSRQLQPLIRSCNTKNFRAELIVKDSEPPLSIETVRNIHAIIRESLTNSLRHGEADYVLVSITFAKGLKLLIMDNGKGCDVITEGTGLEGVRKRSELLGSTVRFTSPPGEGFYTHLTIAQSD